MNCSHSRTSAHSTWVRGWYSDEHGEYRESANGSNQDRNALPSVPQRISVLTNLVALSLAGNPVSDLTPLQGLNPLQSLDCSSTQVRDLTPLIDHPSLRDLNVNRCPLSDLPRRLRGLPYWLEYIRTLGRKDCPVVVTQTRCDRPEQEIRRLPADDAFLEFPSLKPCWYIRPAPRQSVSAERFPRWNSEASANRART